MIYLLKRVLDKEECASFLSYMQSAPFIDGHQTGGSMGRLLKKNYQTKVDQENRAQSERFVSLLNENEKIRAVSIPRSFSQPIFSVYKEGHYYSAHYDCATQKSISGDVLRADLSGTLLLNNAEDFVGGDLSIRLHNRIEKIQLEQGDLVLYQSGLLHEVSPVQNGERRAAVFWMQSMIADAQSRQLVIDYDLIAQRLLHDQKIDPKQAIEITGIYHRMIKQLSD